MRLGELPSAAHTMAVVYFSISCTFYVDTFRGIVGLDSVQGTRWLIRILSV